MEAAIEHVVPILFGIVVGLCLQRAERKYVMPPWPDLGTTLQWREVWAVVVPTVNATSARIVHIRPSWAEARRIADAVPHAWVESINPRVFHLMLVSLCED